MENDSSDILGHKTMPTLNGNQRGWFPLSVTQMLVTSFVFLGIYWLGQGLWKRILQWRERSYRLATRRRHGIPDSDLRPFNVAYSEAVMRTREEESRRQPKPKPALRPQAFLPTQREASVDHNLRHRQVVPQRPDTSIHSTTIPVPGGYNTGAYEPRFQAETSSANGPSQHHVQPTTNGFSKPGLSRHGGYLDISDADALSDTEGRKRALDEEQDEEHEAKKTRVEGDELIDGDEDAEFEDLAPKRGSKRGLRDEEESEDVDPLDTKKSRGKRARKISAEKRPQADESMDVDDEEADEITELKFSTRGKKRDRAEAGSTFGGDDEDSEAELELEGDAKARRRRKRRTVAKRKSEASYIRGKMRERNGTGDVSDNPSDESSPGKKASRKKRGKRSSHVDRRDRERQASKSDVSMDESITSTRSKVRSVGDEWESNGVKYKIGPNYQRLRQALVKKARQKFVMPKDSQHPDRDANLQVCIETWLTEEEYQEAKAQHLLAWQDPPSATRPVETEKLSLNTFQENVPSPQGPTAGKNLLWSTSTSSTPTMSPASQSPAFEAPPELTKQRSYRDTYRHSIATTVGLPISPFTQTQVPTAKRIASNSRAVSLSTSVSGSPGLSDSTNGTPRMPHKVFSKWEKQELEAKAMMKIREANKKKEMEKELKLKEERERAEREAAESQRVERERQERERIERERQAREKAERERAAEADRKAKEAAEKAKAAAAAQAAATATAATSQPGAAAAPSTTGSFVPNFFGPASAAPKVDPSQQPAGFTMFSHPSTGVPQPQGGASAAATQPTSTSTLFGPPSGTSVQKPGAFSFAPSTGGEQKKDGADATGGGGTSLLSRLGPEGTKSQAPSQPASTPMFSFPKTDASTSIQGSSNPFGQPSASTTAASSTTATTTPKFSFNVSNKASAASSTSTGKGPSAFQNTASSSLSGALGSGGDAQKPATTSTPSNFGFKTPTTPASSSAAAASTTPATAPKAFSFGPFGTQAKDGGKSAFGATTTPSAFGTTSTPSSAFGNTTAPSATSAFGNTAASSAFGNTKTFSGNTGSGPSPFGATPAQTQNAFGGAASKPADGAGSKPSFSFANPGSSTPSTTGTTTTNGAPKFSFATTPSPTKTTTPAPANSGTSGGFTFNFGQPADGATAPQASAFGGAAAGGQSVFGGTGTNGNETSTTPSAFGGGGGLFGVAPAAPK